MNGGVDVYQLYAFLLLIIILFSVLIKKKITVGVWSIKVFNSDRILSHPFSEEGLEVPTLQASDVTDVVAEFIADPFIIHRNKTFYMFFEVLDKATNKGIIGTASSKDGVKWAYDRIVLKEKFHLSYPYVFEHNNEVYMIPESIEADGVLLYQTKNFPYEWEVVKTIIPGKYVDPSIFFYNEKWWLFAGQNGKLHLFSSINLFGEWEEHPKSPLITNNYHITRPGGRVIVEDGNIFRYTQSGQPNYGCEVREFKIKRLTESEYEEEENNVVLRGTHNENDWKKDGMHSIDQLKLTNEKWLVAVDGHKLVKRNYVIYKIQNILAQISTRKIKSQSVVQMEKTS